MNLTEEDWNSKEAKNVAVAAAFIVFAAAIVAVAAAVVGAAVAVFVVAAAVVDAALDSKLMRFPGAYLHYRRRIKS